MRSSRPNKEDLGNENDELKKAVKYLAEKNSNERWHLLGKCRVLLEELRKRDRGEDNSTLSDTSRMDVTIVENVL